MNVLNEVWKIASAAWADIAKTLYCLFLRARLKQLNIEIEFMTRYIEKSKGGGASMFAEYFVSRLPLLTAEREDLESELEIAGCST